MLHYTPPFKRLQSLPCNIWRRGLLDCHFLDWQRCTCNSRFSFDTEHALNKTMRSRFMYNNISLGESGIYRRAFPIILQCYAPIINYNFQYRNIIIKRTSPSVSIDALSGVKRLISIMTSFICPSLIGKILNGAQAMRNPT
jgi:hypothetical protein